MPNISQSISKWLDVSYITPTIGVFDCLCNKKHKAFYSKQSNTFSCPICGYSNLDLVELTQRAIGGSYGAVCKKIAHSHPEFREEFLKYEEKEKKFDYYVTINEKALNFWKDALYKNSEALDYLHKRNFSEKDIQEYGIGYAPQYNMLYKYMKKEGYSEEELVTIGLIGFSEKTGRYYDVFRDRIIFPIYDENKKLVGFSGRIYSGDAPAKYLNTKATPLFKKNSLLFNFFNVKNLNSHSILVCEGFMDVIALHKAGIKNAVCTMGTALTDKHYEKLASQKKRIILLFDGDAPGKKATERTLSKYRADFLVLPENLDPDEFLTKYGKDKFLQYAKQNIQCWENWRLKQ